MITEYPFRAFSMEKVIEVPPGLHLGITRLLLAAYLLQSGHYAVSIGLMTWTLSRFLVNIQIKASTYLISSLESVHLKSE